MTSDRFGVGVRALTAVSFGRGAREARRPLMYAIAVAREAMGRPARAVDLATARSTYQ
jgi:hypothetical protein